jgi:ankyrin repeat protein
MYFFLILINLLCFSCKAKQKNVLPPDGETNKTLEEEVIEATKIGNITKLKDLFKHNKVQTNLVDSSGENLLTIVLSNQHNLDTSKVKEMLLFLISQGVDLRWEDDKNQRPLYICYEKIKKGEEYKEIQNILINKIYPDLKSAFFDAIENEDLLTVKILLANEAYDINQKNQKGDSGLSIAVKKGNLAIVEAILATKGIDVNSKGEQGYAPLHLAIRNKNIPILKRLLTSEGIDVNIKDDKGDTPLITNIKLRNKKMQEIFHLLMNTPGINPGITNNNYETAFYIAEQQNEKILFGGVDSEAITDQVEHIYQELERWNKKQNHY